MNILFIHEVDWLNKVVFDMHILAESLSLRGHNVYAIDYENTWKRNGLLDIVSRTTDHENVSRVFEGSSVYLRRLGFIKIPGISRLTAWVSHYFQIRKMIREKNIDALVLYSVPTNGLQSLAAAKDAGIPVLFRSIDVLNQLVPVSGLRSVTRFLEKKVYLGSDLILSQTPGLTGYVKNMGVDEEKIRLMLIPLDLGIFRPGINTDKVRKKWGYDADDRIILFMGTLFDFCGLDDILPLFGKVTEVIPSAKLLVVGDGPLRPAIEQLISDYNLNDYVTITGFEPYEMMPEYINLAEICVNTFRIIGATKDILPGKSVQFLACGKPYVATPLFGLKVVIKGEEQGVVYAEKPEEIITAIVSLLGDPERMKNLGQAGLDYAQRVHSFESITRQLEEYISEAIENKRG